MNRRLVIVFCIILVIIFSMVGCKKDKGLEVAEPVIAESQTEQLRETTLYFRDNSDYVVPVLKKLVWETGIAKAALNSLVAGNIDEDLLLSKGVYAAVPAGTEFDLDIADGKATVDLKMISSWDNAQKEAAMISAVVNTLMEFETVNEVTFLIDGQKVTDLPNGSELSLVYNEPISNIEPVGAPMGSFGKMQLSFINASGSFLIDVSRVVGEDMQPVDALRELTSPADMTGLMSVLPAECQVLDVNMDENVAIVNLSEEFLSLEDEPIKCMMALYAIEEVMTQYEGIDTVEIKIEGKKWEPSATTAVTGFRLNSLD